jgi:spoIIIJ-associated protein
MDWIEVTAKTVEAAKELALDRLGVVEDELEFEVIDQPRSGFLRRSDARIRARVRPLSREKPSDRRRRRGGDRSGGGRSSGGGRERGTTKTEDRGSESTAGERTGNSGGGRSRSRRRRGGSGGGAGSGGGGGGQGRRPATDVANGGTENEDREAQVDVETLPIGEQADFATTFVDELVRAMGFRATVETDVDEDDLLVRVEGDNLGVLVGPRGVTLQALDEVVRAALQRKAGGHSARAHVDVGGYRERRREALAEFARKVASEVKESGAPRSLEPMNAADRKVVHDAVAEVDGVATGSEGEDPRRRVVIRPE